MNRSRLLVAGATALVGAGLVLAPVAAQATPVSTASSSAPGQPGAETTSPVTNVTVVPNPRSVLIVVDVDRITNLKLVQDGKDVDVVQSSDWSSPSRPGRFLVKGTGLDAEDFGITTTGGAPVVPVHVDFGQAAVPQAIDKTSERQIERIAAQVEAGRFDHVLEFEALPGATVSVTTNGVTTTAVADRYGTAEVPVRFRAGSNPQSSFQTFNGKTSSPDTVTWEF
ncbi:hypothetical protein [Curtobacterium sp. PsM8]|uniref:hypothetical protein n=1 Tax=Curtobacterium sp. PsM8 TaxID=3030532 RepID=UPI00263B5581|nr:hypothetical protein [Curtobacterium sp. PsM8]MDN4649525.1 hypothetical protein [Curtobacterium sp. PsM8]